MRKIMVVLVIILSAVLIMSPALAAGKAKGQGNAGGKTNWKSNESPAPPGWGKTQGTRTRTGWGVDGTAAPGITKRGTNPPGFSKGGGKVT